MLIIASKVKKFVLRFLGLMVVAAILFRVIALSVEQRGQAELQAKFLNACFAKVQLQNGQVLIAPAPKYHLLRTMEEGRNPFFTPMLFPVGSQFKASDQHWGATYTIQEIKPEGVVIDFEASGEPRTLVRRSSGTVQLAWK